MKAFFLFVLLFVSGYNISAQSTGSDLSYYFSDKVKDRKNVFKTDILSYIRGEYGISYERAILPNFSFEFGAGRYLTHYLRDFAFFCDPEEQTGYRKKNSYTLNARFKVYEDEALFGYYGSLFFKYSDFKQLKLYDFGFEIGSQPYISKRLALDYSAGITMRFQHCKPGYFYYEDHNIGFLVYFRANIGYRFK